MKNQTQVGARRQNLFYGEKLPGFTLATDPS